MSFFVFSSPWWGFTNDVEGAQECHTDKTTAWATAATTSNKDAITYLASLAHQSFGCLNAFA